MALARPEAAPAADAVGSVVGGLYLRIVIMQTAIIFGAIASRGYGTLAPLVIVIAFKTLIDLVTRLAVGDLRRVACAAIVRKLHGGLAQRVRAKRRPMAGSAVNRRIGA